ncbi:hypothetical protein ACFW1A_10350 [Kitasatospora sp. NPDC058965]|uniref:hypothetical protein n=1 Tax=Kitasatospora sp. NPDC058965 TaxID=3346682 RepID=UPI003688A14F
MSRLWQVGRWRLGLAAAVCAAGTGTAMAVGGAAPDAGAPAVTLTRAAPAAVRAHGPIEAPLGQEPAATAAGSPPGAGSAAPGAPTDPPAGAPVDGPADGSGAAPADGNPGGLDVVAVSVDRLPRRGTTTLRVLIANYGPAAVDAEFTATVHLPARAFAFGAFFPHTCHPDPAGPDLVCSFPQGLPLERTATVLLPVRPADDVRAGERLTGGLVTVADPDHPGASRSRAFEIDVD